MIERVLDRLPRWFPAVFIVLVTLLVYGTIIRDTFVEFDDGILIFQNPTVKEFSMWSIKRAFTTYDPELYIPLTLMLYQVIHAIVGLEPWLYHTVSLTLHTLNAVLVYWIAEMFLRRRDLALVTALLFAVHPLNTEAVAWASGLKDVFSTFFFLVALGCYMEYRDEERGYLRLQWLTGKRMGLYLSILAFGIGLLAKVSIITLPILLLLLDWRDRRLSLSAILEKIPYLVLCAIFGVIAVIGKQKVIGGSHPLETLLLGFKSIGFYAQKFLLPVDLTVIYPQATPVTARSPEFFVPIILTILVVTVGIVAARRYRSVTLAIFWALITVSISFSNFRKIGFLFFASDRYVYISSIGVFLLLAVGLSWIMNRARARQKTGIEVGVIAMIVILSGLAFRQALTWRTTETLFRHAIATVPSAIAYSNLGFDLSKSDRRDEAIPLFQKAIETDPRLLTSYVNLGTLAKDRGDYAEAAMWYRRGIAMIPALDRGVIPEDLALYYYLGEVEAQLGHDDEAIAAFRTATEVGSAFAEPFYNLGVQMELRGWTDQAETAHRKAVELNNEYIPAHYHLAGILSGRGELPEAIALLEQVVRVNPGYAKAQEHLKNMRAIVANAPK